MCTWAKREFLDINISTSQMGSSILLTVSRFVADWVDFVAPTKFDNAKWTYYLTDPRVDYDNMSIGGLF